MKKYFYISLLACTLISCTDDFLKEEMVSTITQDYFNTEQGLNQLVVGTYNAERVKWGYSEGVYMFETGHDCTRKSGDNDLNMYSASKWSSTGDIGNQTNQFMGFQSKPDAGFLINFFPIIDNCNKAITIIRNNEGKGQYASNKKYAAQRLSEVLFNRAYSYYNLNTILGDIYFSTTSSTTLPPNYAYTRTPSEEMYRVLISDLRYAIENLPEEYSSGEFGRATKYAAAHLLAKMYLHREQGKEYGTAEYGRNTDGSIDNSNPKSYLGMLYKGKGIADLDSCIHYASMVINKHPLASDYADLFDHSLDDFSCENTSENVLNAVFSEGGDNYRYGIRVLMMFVGNYVGEKWGLPDYCWEYGTKPNFNFHNSDFGFDVFTDKINDSRFQKSFRLEYKTGLNTSGSSTPGANGEYYAYNDENNATYLWTDEQANYFNQHILPTYNRESWKGRKAVAGEHKMGRNDLAFGFLENTKATAIDVKEANAQPFILYARWMKEGNNYYYRPELVGATNSYTFAGTKNYYSLEKSSNTGIPCSIKYDDPNRTGKSSEYGGRDIPIMRSAEMYLVRAEAYGRKGEYGKAIDDINALRRRAAFKAGEERNEIIARLYPGKENLNDSERQWPYESMNDCFEKIKVNASFWDGTSEKSLAENYVPSANTTEKRFIEFIYNEWAREFNQEEIYYEGIHHAGIQAARIQWHNQMGANINHTDFQAGSWEVSDNVSGNNGQTGLPKGGFQNHMTLKPFPQKFLDMLTDESGTPLDANSKKAYQNYGY